MNAKFRSTSTCTLHLEASYVSYDSGIDEISLATVQLSPACPPARPCPRLLQHHACKTGSEVAAEL